MNFLKYRVPLYAAIALLLWMAFQWTLLYIKGVSYPTTQSIYHPQRTTLTAKPLKPPKGSVPLIQQVKGFKTPPSALDPTPKFTIGRWDIPNCPPQGVTISVTADERGVPEATYMVKPAGFFDIGRTREAGLYGNYGLESSTNTSTYWVAGVYYRQDIGRIGSAWLSVVGEAGYKEVTFPDGGKLKGAEAKVGLKIGVRF